METVEFHTIIEFECKMEYDNYIYYTVQDRTRIVWQVICFDILFLWSVVKSPIFVELRLNNDIIIIIN